MPATTDLADELGVPVTELHTYLISINATIILDGGAYYTSTEAADQARQAYTARRTDATGLHAIGTDIASRLARNPASRHVVVRVARNTVARNEPVDHISAGVLLAVLDAGPDPFDHDRMAVLSPAAARQVAALLLEAAAAGHPTRVVIDDGVKVDAIGTWTAPIGRTADDRGR